jgi:hypothetical protein
VRLLRGLALRQPPIVEGAYATVVATQVQLITVLTEQVATLEEQVDDHFPASGR